MQRLASLLLLLCLASCSPTVAGAGAAAAGAAPPVLRTNFPDPFVLPHGDRYYAYATNMTQLRANVPIAFSHDLANWQMMGDPESRSGYRDALPVLPGWATAGFTWAPEVLPLGGRFILYFTARHSRTSQQCIGAAVSADPRGPFVPHGDAPLVCQHELGGTIDASPFRDADGQLYLYFKNDGNHPTARRATEIWGQRLAPDGLAVLGEPVSLARNDQEWEGHIVEAPFMVRRGDRYILFFSANDFAWHAWQPLSRYATGFARCEGPLGPCADAPENPILASRRRPDCLSGPGHPMVFEANGRQYMAFHAWATGSNCRSAGDARQMHIARIEWRGDVPVVGGAPGE
ncbi:MAG: glycoside hydrolase family 43 protein [Pseudomonadota bacterium]|nr:glycoside hydrolase family 43 protein [Pseudomonadota bacterium]